MLETPDAQLAMQAAELIKSGESGAYRIEVKAESVAMQDFTAMKSERMEVLAGLSQFLMAAGPLMQAAPAATPFLLQMLQWSLSGVKGSSEIEAVLDRAIEQAQQTQGQGAAPPPDTKLLSMQMRGQQEMAKEQAKLQGDLVRIQAETQAADQREQSQATWNVREAAQKAFVSRSMAQQAQEPNGPKRFP
jgi:hypothetical protein